MSFWNIVYVVVAVIVLFGAAVFVHEYGHFWMARRRGLKVEGFSIGFGPRLIGWTRDGVEYAWRLIPAGGYVKLPQMTTATLIEGQSPDGQPLPPASPGSKILVAAAGPLMNILFAFGIATLIWAVGLPEPVNPPIVGYVEPGSEEERLGIQPGDRVLQVDGQRIRSWQDINLATALARTNVVEVVTERNGQYFTNHLRTAVNEAFGLKLLRLEPRDHPEVVQVHERSAAAEAGLQVGDRILAFAGVPIVNREQLIDLIRQRPDQPSEIRIERNGQKLALTIRPRLDPVSGQGRIGVALASSSTQMYVVQRPGPPPWTQVADVVDKTFKTLMALVYSKQTGVGAKDLSGPVGILAMLAAWVNTDYRLALSFLVLLNVNLAILNLLPVPVLDGGHILMALFEKVRGRPLSVQVVEYTTTAFAVLLLSFMLYVTFFDLRRLPLFSAWFKARHQIEQAAPEPTASDRPRSGQTEQR
ncbi:MAG: RIP metalloprotease RseP [Verrucomicrobiota bacterium]|nr:RIP metalloprotease RseP [Limisphaera sp.]MDW8381330.1 RIP metalloprotease RseP [Verrucomicrobiota bacterium]